MEAVDLSSIVEIVGTSDVTSREKYFHHRHSELCFVDLPKHSLCVCTTPRTRCGCVGSSVDADILFARGLPSNGKRDLGPLLRG